MPRRSTLRGRLTRGRGAYRTQNFVVGRGSYRAPKRSYVRGKGGFFGAIGRGIKRFGRGLITGGLHKAISNVVSGSGDYNLPQDIKYNSLFKRGIPGSDVAFMHSTTNSVRIVHREFIGTVNSTLGFVNTSFNLNPGIATTFPWLSNIASHFISYKIHGFLAELKTTAGQSIASTNTALGIVGLSSNPNSAQIPYGNRQQFLNSYGAVSCVPSQSAIMGIECARNLQANAVDTLYVRTGPLTANDSIQLYDMATIQVCSDGAQSNNQVSELWFSYDIELINPTIQLQSMSSGALSANYALASPTNANKLGTSRAKTYDNLGLTFPDNNTIALPLGADGSYLIELYYNSGGSGVMTWAAGNATATNGTLTYLACSPATGGTSTNLLVQYIVKVTNASLPTTIVFNNSPATGIPTGLTAPILLVVALGPTYP